MNHWKTLLLLLLCLIMLCALAACGPRTPDDSSDEPTGGLQLLNEDGSFRYVVVRSQTANSAVKTMGVTLRKGAEDTFGVDVTLKDDWVEYSLSEEEVADYYEILIGDTKRPESRAALESLTEPYSYKIEVMGNKIVLVGSNDKATEMAVQYFLDTYITPKAAIPIDLLYSGAYTPDRVEIVKEDHSTGALNPRLVQTKYPTEDVVIADIIVTEDGYAVSPDGMGNSTPGIQKALNDCAAGGGGTVYLPAGMYAITGQIVIPPFVTLRGDWQDPDKGTEYGTILLMYVESEDDNQKGTIMLGGSAGVVGMTVYYPEQDIDNVKPYPHIFYTDGDGNGNNYMLSTVKNVTVLNGYRGVGTAYAKAHEQLTLENIKGTFLCTGFEIYNQADFSTSQNLVINNKYWKESAVPDMPKVDGDKLDAYTRENTIGLKLGDLEWTQFALVKIRDCRIGIWLVKGARWYFNGTLLDLEILNCETGLLVNDIDARFGMTIARSVIEGGIINTTGGRVKLCDVEVSGRIQGDVYEDKESDLSEYEIDYERTYKKPAEILYVVTGLDKTGKTDSTATVQAVLNEAAQTGGVVYISGGMYRFDGTLIVPAGVELRGATSVATRDQFNDHNGTLFLCYYGDDADCGAEDDAFITLDDDYAGLNGIRILYPENSPYTDDLNTTYAVRGKGMGVYAVNSSISAATYGIDFRDCDEHFIKKVTACCYNNAFRLGGEGGMLTGVLHNGTVLTRCNIPLVVNWCWDGTIMDDLIDPILRQSARVVIVEDAEDQQIYGIGAYGSSTLITCIDSSVLVTNIVTDNLGDDKAQIAVNGGEVVVINSQRYNGHSFDHESGELKFYNRLTIGDKGEQTYIKSK